MKPKMKQFGYWEADPKDPSASYWQLYDSLEDAVSDKGDGAGIYVLSARYLGRFKRKVVLLKQSERGNVMKKAKAKSKKRAIGQGTKPSKKLTVKKLSAKRK